MSRERAATRKTFIVEVEEHITWTYEVQARDGIEATYIVSQGEVSPISQNPSSGKTRAWEKKNEPTDVPKDAGTGNSN